MPQASSRDGHNILIDIGRTRIRWVADQRSGLITDLVQSTPTDQYIDQTDAVFEIINMTIDQYKFDRARTSVFVSLPTFVIEDQVVFNDRLQRWNFSISNVRQATKLKTLFFVNDMSALGHSIWLVLRRGDHSRIGHGVPRFKAPILAIGIRSGVGALGFALVEKPSGEHYWLPVNSEGGHIEVAPANDTEAEILAAMRARLGRAATASDVLSGEGSIDLYRCVASKYGIAPDPALKAAGFKALTRATGPEADAARETISLWCSFLGSFVRNLALAFGAHGGVYIAGPVTRDFLAADETKNRQVFRERFTAGGPGANYLISMPTSLITHPDPYLLGLSRFR